MATTLVHRIISPFLLACTAAANPIGEPRLQTLPGREVHPSAVASVIRVDDRIVLTSDWIPLSGSRGWPIWIGAFDSCEHELIDRQLGPPTDNAPFGCVPAGVPAGSRWFLGPYYNNPFISADLITSSLGAGRTCHGLGIDWYVRVGENEPDHDNDGFPDTELIIAIFTSEDMDVVTCGDDGSDVYFGLAYTINTRWDPDAFNYANIDTCCQFGHMMPSDGTGGYLVFLAIAEDPQSGQLILPMGIDPVSQTGVAAQMMLWGTGEHEPVDDGRPGDEVDGQFDDVNPTDGHHDLATECFSQPSGCPDPLAPSIGFYYLLPRCQICPGDVNSDQMRDINDLALLLGSFGLQISTCEDIDNDGFVTMEDLAWLLAEFGRPC